MPAALAEAAGRSLAGFQVAYVDSDGLHHQEPLAVGWVARLEHAQPVRKFPSYRGQRSFPGLWWSATTGEHVGFESWLEREHVMLLDFDPSVIAVSSQPFWLLWPSGRRLGRHAPDFFARLDDGTGLVVDVRADDQIPASDAEVFALTARACASVGWAYRRVGIPDPVLAANVRWLAGYRHARCANSEMTTELRRVFSRPVPLLEGVRTVGDPIGVLPVAFHLLWAHILQADLACAPLSGASLVTVAGVTS